LHPLESQELLHLIFELLKHVFIASPLLQPVVLGIQESLHLILMVTGWPLPVHLGVVVEEVGIDFVEDPRLLHHVLLHEDEEGRGDPVDEGSGRPLVREGQVEELEDLEEGAEAIHEPVLILFRDASLKRLVSCLDLPRG
jgi:hypothetical protein